MKKLVFLLLFVFCAVNCQAAQEGKAYLEDILNMTCPLGCTDELDPEYENDAETLIHNARYLAYFDSQYKMEKYNKPLESMGVKLGKIIPEGVVNDALCKYYGYTTESDSNLANAAFKIMNVTGFYFINIGVDFIPVTYKIEKISKANNGLLIATGTFDGLDTGTFKAFFRKSNCGGKEHWVIMKVNQTN